MNKIYIVLTEELTALIWHYCGHHKSIYLLYIWQFILTHNDWKELWNFESISQ